MLYVLTELRPHKVDLQIIVTIFPIFQAGGRSLFIIHWSISFIKASHAPQKETVWRPACEGQRLTWTIEIATNLGWFC